MSGDDKPPELLEKLMKKNAGHIGFLSWQKAVVPALGNIRKMNPDVNIVIEEFGEFLKLYLKGVVRLADISVIRKVYEEHPGFSNTFDTVLQMLMEILKETKESIIDKYSPIIEQDKAKKDNNEDFPCIYYSFENKHWHAAPSGFIFCDVLTNRFGVVFIAYESVEEKEDYHRYYPEAIDIIKKTEGLKMFTYANEYKGNPSDYYCKEIDEETGARVYIGFTYDIDEVVNDRDEYIKKISEDAGKLLKLFKR